MSPQNVNKTQTLFKLFLTDFYIEILKDIIVKFAVLTNKTEAEFNNALQLNLYNEELDMVQSLAQIKPTDYQTKSDNKVAISLLTVRFVWTVPELGTTVGSEKCSIITNYCKKYYKYQKKMGGPLYTDTDNFLEYLNTIITRQHLTDNDLFDINHKGVHIGLDMGAIDPTCDIVISRNSFNVWIPVAVYKLQEL